MSDFQEKPKREIRFRDIRWSVFYFFWKNTWFVRRLWCKHHGPLMCGTDTKFVTICSNCFSPKVPQMCNAVGLMVSNPEGQHVTVNGKPLKKSISLDLDEYQ